MEEWFKVLGFSENPFSIKPTEEIVGCKDALKEIFYKIDSSNMMYLEGEFGSGKTSVLKHVIKKYGGRKKVVHVYCNKIKDYETIALMKGGLGKVLRVKRKGLIVLLDEADHINGPALELVQNHFDEDVFKSVVFSGTDAKLVLGNRSVAERIGKGVVKLDSLKDEEAVKLVKNRVKGNGILSDDTVKRIYGLSKKNPRKLLQYCEYVCRAAFEKATGGNPVVDKAFHNEVDDICEKIRDRVKEGGVAKFLRYISE